MAHAPNPQSICLNNTNYQSKQEYSDKKKLPTIGALIGQCILCFDVPKCCKNEPKSIGKSFFSLQMSRFIVKCYKNYDIAILQTKVNKRFTLGLQPFSACTVWCWIYFILFFSSVHLLCIWRLVSFCFGLHFMADHALFLGTKIVVMELLPSLFFLEYPAKILAFLVFNFYLCGQLGVGFTSIIFLFGMFIFFAFGVWFDSGLVLTFWLILRKYQKFKFFFKS